MAFFARHFGGLEAAIVEAQPIAQKRQAPLLQLALDGDEVFLLEAVLRSDDRYVYLAPEGLVGERISLTAIESPLNGERVRTTDDPAPAATEDSPQSVAEE